MALAPGAGRAGSGAGATGAGPGGSGTGPVIDLGEVGADPGAAASDAAPPPRRLRLAGLLAAAVLAGLSPGAAAPTGAALTESTVPRERADRVFAIDDTLYLVGGWPADPRTRVTARRLPDGAPRWTATLAVPHRVSWVYRRAGVVLLLAQPHPEAAEVTAMDADTGGELWRRAGDLLGYATGPVGTTLGLFKTPASAPSPAEVTVTAVDLRSGAVAWSLRAPPESAVEVGAGAGTADDGAGTGFDDRTLSRVVVGQPTGRVELRGAADGRLLGTLPAPPRRHALPPWLAVSHDLALVHQPGTPAVVTAYDLGGRTRRWSVPWDAGPLGSAGLMARDCGLLVCLSRPDRTRAGLDRSTGAVRWTGRWHRLETVAGWPVGTQESDGELQVLDPASGAVRHRLGGWRVVSAPVLREAVLAWTDAPRSRTWLGRLDPGTGRVLVLGRADGLLFECHPGRDSAVCRRADGSLGLWRYG